MTWWDAEFDRRRIFQRRDHKVTKDRGGDMTAGLVLAETVGLVVARFF
jgi:hypothetical protein